MKNTVKTKDSCMAAETTRAQVMLYFGEKQSKLATVPPPRSSLHPVLNFGSSAIVR
jgi:hypothetical protein